jgi:hypothetical protein
VTQYICSRNNLLSLTYNQNVCWMAAQDERLEDVNKDLHPRDHGTVEVTATTASMTVKQYLRTSFNRLSV